MKKTTKNKIEELKNTNKMYKHVISDILEYSKDFEELKSYVNDIITYGCISGTVTSMIYYTDTVKFFDEFEEYIQELAEELDFEVAEYTIFELAQLKNKYSWFAYEQVAYRLNDILL